eukprot:scaffold2910_cov390-Prasinococcus_capsulatus_cf.AAC.40
MDACNTNSSGKQSWVRCRTQSSPHLEWPQPVVREPLHTTKRPESTLIPTTGMSISRRLLAQPPKLPPPGKRIRVRPLLRRDGQRSPKSLAVDGGQLVHEVLLVATVDDLRDLTEHLQEMHRLDQPFGALLADVRFRSTAADTRVDRILHDFGILVQEYRQALALPTILVEVAVDPVAAAQLVPPQGRDGVRPRAA